MKKIKLLIPFFILILVLTSCANFDINSLMQSKVKVTIINDVYYNDTTVTSANISIYKDNEKVAEVKTLESGKTSDEIQLDKGTYTFKVFIDDNNNGEKSIEVKDNMNIKVSDILN
jgi:hypothetical protein